MKKIKFRIIKELSKVTPIYYLQRKRFGFWFYVKYSPGMDCIATLPFETEDKAIDWIKSNTDYKPERISIIQYPTLLLHS